MAPSAKNQALRPAQEKDEGLGQAWDPRPYKLLACGTTPAPPLRAGSCGLPSTLAPPGSLPEGRPGCAEIPDQHLSWHIGAAHRWKEQSLGPSEDTELGWGKRGEYGLQMALGA